MPNLIGGKRNLAGCRPLDGSYQQALELGDFKVGVGFVCPGMPEHGCVDAAFAVIADPIHGFVALGIFAVGVSEDAELFEGLGRAVLAVSELFGFVLPRLG